MLSNRILYIGCRLKSNINLICRYTKFEHVHTKTIRFNNNQLSKNLHLNNYPLNSVYRCTIHTSPKRYNPIISIFVRQVLKVTTLFTARAIRKWYKNLPDNKRELVIAWLVKHKWKFFLLTFFTTLSTVYYYQSHLQTTPITNRKRFIAFTAEQFKIINQIELEAKLEEFSNRLLNNNHPITRRVAKVAKQLINGNKDIKQIEDHEWTVSVIDDLNMVNAFVLASGNIFVYSGILKLCKNDDQLGIILSHEISHAILGHGLEMASHAHIVDIIFIVLLGFVWMFFPTDLIAAIGSTISRFVMKIMMDTPYSKMLEIEADEVGLLLAAKACFDIREASVFWDKMNFMEKSNLEEMYGTTELPNLDFLATHPSHQERSDNLKKLIDNAINCREKSGCPPLPKIDPRESIKNDFKSNAERIKKELNVLLKLKDFREL